ncbi:MAG: hypothetical protein QMD53_05970 [Actinomycetota bacterium]|nr:hypothetical protein [Actinomycetota bacterium]
MWRPSQMNVETKPDENYPLWIVLLSNSVSLLIYGIGSFILWGLGTASALLYLAYCLSLELRLLKMSCVNCYYYGKTCAFGKGKLASIFLKKGDPKRFIEKDISWRDMLPDMMVLILPLAGGILHLIIDFSWLIPGLLVALVLLSLGGNAFIRGSLACKRCKQRELGCPAEQLFSQSDKKTSKEGVDE